MSLRVATGTYIGNGGTTGTRVITGIGFQPKVIFVWSNKVSVSGYFGGPNWFTDTIQSGLGSALATFGENGIATASTYDRFQSLDTDGFTIVKGSNSAESFLNDNTVQYYYLALGGSNVSSH